MKNPFKKKSLVDTLMNVGIGGVANVAIDYVWNMAGLDNIVAENITFAQSSTVKNAVKVLGGALAGGMVSGRYGRAAADGVATVGASNLIADLINGSDVPATTAPSSGLPSGTIGRVGRRIYPRGRKIAGVGNNPSSFMSE